MLRADATVVSFGADAEARGPDAVARTFAGRAKAARLALVDGAAGLAWFADGTPKVVFDFTVVGDRVVGIELLADPEVLASLELELVD